MSLLLRNNNEHRTFVHNVLKLKHWIRENKPKLLLRMKNSFSCKAHLWMCFVSLPDSLGGQFPSTSHRCHHKPKRCLPIQCGTIGGALPMSPLLFHPNAKGSQIVMDLTQKTVKRQASFCNAITFTNRPITVYEQVRLKVLS